MNDDGRQVKQHARNLCRMLFSFWVLPSHDGIKEDTRIRHAGFTNFVVGALNRSRAAPKLPEISEHCLQKTELVRAWPVYIGRSSRFRPRWLHRSCRNPMRKACWRIRPASIVPRFADPHWAARRSSAVQAFRAHGLGCFSVPRGDEILCPATFVARYPRSKAFKCGRQGLKIRRENGRVLHQACSTSQQRYPNDRVQVVRPYGCCNLARTRQNSGFRYQKVEFRRRLAVGRKPPDALKMEGATVDFAPCPDREYPSKNKIDSYSEFAVEGRGYGASEPIIGTRALIVECNVKAASNFCRRDPTYQLRLTVGVGVPIPIAPFLGVCAFKPLLRSFWPLAGPEAEACSSLPHAAQYAQWEPYGSRSESSEEDAWRNIRNIRLPFGVEFAIYHRVVVLVALAIPTWREEAVTWNAEGSLLTSKLHTWQFIGAAPSLTKRGLELVLIRRGHSLSAAYVSGLLPA
ncbi:hypothetical protein KC344_g214 [Hortaea werneckii]|nr:hypothetical protein KC344_g214 [Hortaea werneckii]